MGADIASLAEPLATALNAIDGIRLDQTSSVAVIGLGSIGLLSMYAAQGAAGSSASTLPSPAVVIRLRWEPPTYYLRRRH